MIDSSKTLVVNGAPGSGKTRTLIGVVEEELANGTPPDRIGYISFTRKAADEARERAESKFDLTARQLPHFRTIHSLCFRALGMDSASMFEGKKVLEAADWLGVRMSGRGISADEGGMTTGYDAGDRILFMTNLARVRGITLEEQYALDHDNLGWMLVDRVARGLEEFKTKRGLRDFTDLLQEFVDTGFRVPLDVLIVDEAQDLSRLQWRVVDRLAEGTRRIVIGGDDDQAIFQWAGADVQTFIDMPGQVQTLDQSWRVPRSVAEVAGEVLSRVKNRRPKIWKPRLDERGKSVEGEVRRVVSLDEVDFQSGEDTLVLSRNLKPLRDDAEPLLRGDGILYESQYGHSSVKRSIVDAILTWEKLRRGEHVPVRDAEKVYEQMVVGRGFLRGHKKLPGFPDRDAMVDTEALVMNGGLLQTDAIWHEALEKLPREDRVYMTKALRTGQKLTERPTVRLSTIHGSKGGEADHVVLMRDVAYRTARETGDQWEAEARCFYVGVTRAKQKLTIVAPQTRHSYDV